jgi:hypothetical protein
MSVKWETALGSWVNLTDDGTLVVHSYDEPIDLGEAIRGKTFDRLHIYGKPTNLDLLGSLTHVVGLLLKGTGHTDFTSITGLTRLRELSYYSGSLKSLDLKFTAGTLKTLLLGRHRLLRDLRPIEVCRGLEALSLSALTNITNYPNLARFRSLKRLELVGLRTWPSLHGLKGAVDLESLCVARTKIEDGRWEVLLRLKKLEFVGGMANALGRDAVAEIKRKRPEVQVAG